MSKSVGTGPSSYGKRIYRAAVSQKLRNTVVVGIATGYGLDGPGIESRWRREFPHLFRSALGSTQPSVQWVPGLSRGVKSSRGLTLTLQPLLVPWSRNSRAISLLPL